MKEQRILVRIPGALKVRLQKRAKRNKRSSNSEILVAIENHVAKTNNEDGD